MKKIITAVAAIAMATSMFAVDVAAQLKMKTSLFDSASKQVIKTPESTGFDINNTFAKFAVSADKAGASFLLKGQEAKIDDMQLWLQPTDSVKVTLGNVATGSLIRGTFAWWHRTVRVETNDAITVNANIGDVAVEFVTFNDALFDFSKEGYGMVGSFFLAANFGLGDAGTLQAVVEKGADLSAYGVGGWEGGALTAVGVAYDHMPWQQTGFYGDAFVAFANDGFKFTKVVSQIGGQYVADGLSLRLTNMLAYGKKYGADAAFYYGFVARAQYAMDAARPYLEVKGHEIMDKKAEINVGAELNVGSCAIDASFHTNFTAGADFAFDLPVVCTVTF